MTKEEDFERLWNSPNYAKACKFRNWVMQKTRVRGLEPTKENCRKYYSGQI
ncbi:MAG: hypothetical protein N3F63_02845 [Thermoplasmata archaeon]|nr:hypothetical protein [Thermoplasmata archaeon]